MTEAQRNAVAVAVKRKQLCDCAATLADGIRWTERSDRSEECAGCWLLASSTLVW